MQTRWTARRGPLILGVAVLPLLAWGCERGSGRVTGPSAATTAGASQGRAVEAGRSVTAELRDPFLFAHNARFFHGRTFRWVPPIPIHVLTGHGDIDTFLLDQFAAWERVLAGTFAPPLYEDRPLATSIPARGIFFAVADLPDPFVGVGDPITPLAESPRSRRAVVGPLHRRIELRASRRQVEVPEIGGNGEIRRCVIVLDPDAADLDDLTGAALIRHEIGHCLGFIGHVSCGLMAPAVEIGHPSFTITSDVANMMRKLYRLAPGTRVTR